MPAIDEKKITIGVVDDQDIIRSALVCLINSFNEPDGNGYTYEVTIEASSGENMIEQLHVKSVTPQILLLDVSMPGMDGFEAAIWLKDNRPDCRVLLLSMFEDEATIIRVLRNGIRGYLAKNAPTPELKNAITSMAGRGYYYGESILSRLTSAVNKMQLEEAGTQYTGITERETELLRLLATELTYRDIAEKMDVSPRTVDGFRESLFEKLNVKTRVGLVIYAIKNGIVKLN
ncbi:MAG: response regulator transcription factor [Chitinophagaceae bacterium]